MSVHSGDTVKINYRGQLNTGEVLDESVGEEPVEFIVGSGQVIEAIDSGVLGLDPGDRINVHVTPENGYGERRPDLIRTVPRELLGQQQVSPGEALEIQTQDGQLVVAEVKSVDSNTVTFDLNHPFAGKDLFFEVELVDIVRKAA